MTYDEFIDTYKPVTNHLDDNAAFDGWMFETYGVENDYVNTINKTDACRVWTIIDSEGLAIIAGKHWVNRIGYLITEIPWEDENIEIEFDEVTDETEYDEDDE